MVVAAVAAIVVVVTVRKTTRSGEVRETPWCALLAPLWLTRGAEGTVQNETHKRKKNTRDARRRKEGVTDAVSLQPCTSRSNPSTQHRTTCSLTHGPPNPSPQNPKVETKETQARADRQEYACSLPGH